MMDNEGINYENNITAIEAKLLLKQWITVNIEPQIDEYAKNCGYEVLFTPSYHSDLQPIELLWVLIKGNIGRSYSAGTTLLDVQEKLESEFLFIDTEKGRNFINNKIESVDKKIEEFRKDMIANEETTTPNFCGLNGNGK